MPGCWVLKGSKLYKPHQDGQFEHMQCSLHAVQFMTHPITRNRRIIRLFYLSVISKAST
jgi:hypothetical protein